MDQELAKLASHLPDASPEWKRDMLARCDQLLDVRIVLARQEGGV